MAWKPKIRRQVYRMRRNLTSIVKLVIIMLLAISCVILVHRAFSSDNKSSPQSTNQRPQGLGNYEAIKSFKHKFRENRDTKKVDWHDYKQIQADLAREGVGEQGKPAYVNREDQLLEAELYKVNGYNGALSDIISLQRAIPDIRHPDCRKFNYSIDLPTVSVIIPFHNEHFSTLIRTCYSVIDRSPPHLLKEIILVDDFSDKISLRDALDEYLEENLPKVRVIHLEERSGLIRARLAGAEVASAEVLIFLDSHCEANVNWLPPLLDPIAEDYRTCVCPFIDVIAHDTYEYRAQDEGARGAFDWEFYYKRLPRLEEDKLQPAKPFKSPVMAGGLFAISAKFFWELGGYDEGLEIWGGEQYELSFKVWQCGGQMLDAPCSRVGHIYRKFAPFPNPNKGDFIARNYKRVAEVWMDEYKDYLYSRKPHWRHVDAGDLTEQKAVREKLQCKPFKWFMEEIAFDLPKKYPPIEPEDFANGTIRNVLYNLCIDTQGLGTEHQVGLKRCITDNPSIGEPHEQEFELGWQKDIKPKGRNMCFDVSDPGLKGPLNLFSCHGYGGNQLWKYRADEMWLVHGGNPRCLDVDPESKLLYVTKCDPGSQSQRWKIQNVNPKQLEKWEGQPFQN